MLDKNSMNTGKTWCLAVVFAVGSFFAAMPTMAQRSYKQSAGVMVGGLDGLSYKYFLSNHLAVQADLGFRMLATQGSARIISGGVTSKTDAVVMNCWTFEVNPNIVYQSLAGDWDWGGLSWFAGGGAGLGLLQGYGSTTAQGKWGVNAIAGLELGLDDAPLTIGLDFRPGYGMAFTGAQNGYSTVIDMFDWALTASIRYTF